MSPSSAHARIEHAFGRWGALIVHRRWSAIGLSFLFTATLVSGLPQIQADFSDDGFLRAGDDTLRVYDAFRARYGRNDRILVGIEAPEIFDLGFLERLRDFHNAVEREVPYLEQVTSLVNARDTRGETDELIVEELLERWPRNAAQLAEAKSRALSNPLYVNNYLSRDHKFAALIIKADTYSSLSGPGVEEAAEWFEEDEEGDAPAPEYLTPGETGELIRVLRGVMSRYEIPDFRLYLVGGEVLGDHMTRIATADVALYTSISVLSIAALLWLLFRRVSAAVLPLFVVAISALATFGAMAQLGIPFTFVTQILPSFLIAVGVCDSVHILTLVYQRLEVGDDRGTAIAFGLEHSGLAVVLTSLTTAGGLVSFVAAEITPVAQFGVAAPIGVLLALCYSLTLLPALLAVLPLARPRPTESRKVGRSVVTILTRLGDLATEHPRSVLLAAAVLVAAALPGVLAVRFSNDNLAWLFEDDPFRAAIERIDLEFEGVERLEILVDSGRENGLHEPAILRRIESVAAHVQSFDDGPVKIGTVFSIVDIVKEINQALHENRPEHRILPDDRRLIAQELLLFENSGSDDLNDVTDSRFQEARVTLRARMVDGMFYVSFLEKLEEDISEILGDGIEFRLTGTMALGSRAFSLLFSSLLRSYALALLVISPLLILMIGNLRRGLLSMIPNLLPVYLVLSLMGWLDIPMNISTMLVGSIVIGLAVDDTIHFMHKFNRYYKETGDAVEAVRRTLATTGRAMLVTTLVLAASFFVFLLGGFWGTVHLGILAGSATIVAFLADVLVAPALMVVATSKDTGVLPDDSRNCRTLRASPAEPGELLRWFRVSAAASCGFASAAPLPSRACEASRRYHSGAGSRSCSSVSPHRTSPSPIASPYR